MKFLYSEQAKENIQQNLGSFFAKRGTFNKGGLKEEIYTNSTHMGDI